MKFKGLNHSMVIAALALGLALAASCGGGGSTGDPGLDAVAPGDVSPDTASTAVLVDTILSSSTIKAGSPLGFTCVGEDEFGDPASISPELEIGGTEAFVILEDEIVFQETGNFTVTCVDKKSGLKDETPAPVEVVAGPPATVETSVNPSQVAAGEPVEVTCLIYDEFGNLAAKEFAGVQVTPSESVETVEFTLTATKAGTYQVACTSGGGTVVDDTPATLTVVAGELSQMFTTLEEDTIPAGENTKVTCSGGDEFGNPVELDAFIIEVPEEVTLAGTTVSGTKAGSWAIVCNQEGGGVETNPATLKITALDAVGVKLKLLPAMPAYPTMMTVTVGFDIVDMYGNPLPGGEIEPPTIEPESGVEFSDVKKFKFLVEGRYEVSSCVVGYPDRCDTMEVWCDGTAPDLVIDFPPRGAMLGGDRDIVVTGTAKDATSSMGQFTINGELVSVAQDGTFAHTITANQGQNIIEAIAMDPFENTADITQAFHFSTVYHQADNNNIVPVSLIDQGVKLYLDDLLFFNQDPTDQNNLSALIKTMLMDLDLASMLPNPVASQQVLLCPYEIYLYDVTFGEPDVRFQPEEGTLGLHASLNDFSADFVADGDNWSCLPLEGQIVADSIILNASLAILVTPDGKLDIKLQDVQVTFVGLELVMADWVDWLADLLVTSMTNMIESEVEKQITALAEDLSAQISELLDSPIPIPLDMIPGTDQVLLQVTIRFEYVDIQPPGVDMAANLAITADKRIDLDPLGSLGYANCLGDAPTEPLFDTFFPEKIELAAFLDLVNQALFSLWLNGGLNLELGPEELAELGADVSAYGLGDLAIKTAPLLPPVITDCNESGALTLQVGDFYLEADFSMLGIPVDLNIYLFIEVEAELAILDTEEGKKIAITIKDPKVSKVDIVYLNEEWDGQEGMFVGLFTETIIPMIFEQLAAEPIAFAIPAINLANLASGSGGEAPAIELPNKELVVDLSELKMKFGYLLARSGLLIQDAPPPQE